MDCIWAKNRKISNDELCFVTKIKPIKNAILSVIARDVFNIYINGKFVCYGPARAGHSRLRIEKIDLDGYLTEEENVIVIDVVSYYSVSLAFTMEEPLFGAEITENGLPVLSSADFSCYLMSDRVIKTERMSSQRGYIEYYIMNEDRQAFYSGDTSLFAQLSTERVKCPTLCEKNVHDCKYEIKEGRLAESFGVKYVDNPPWICDMTKLLDDASPLKSYDRKDCDRVVSYKCNSFKNTEEKVGDAEGVIYDFGRDLSGKICIKVKAITDCKIYCVYDEVLIGGDVVFNREDIMHVAAWEIAAGEYNLTTAEPYTYRFIKLVIEGKAKVYNVRSITIENPDTGRFSFTCEDKDLESVIIAAKHSLEQNAVDILTDCPSRERSGWLCDSYFSSQAERFFTGANRVEYNHLENYAYFTGMKNMREKALPMCYPSESSSGTFIPNWICWLVFEIAGYYDRTGDKRLFDKTKEKVSDIAQFFSEYENEFGLLEDLPGWIFIEWSKANDYVNGVNFPSNMLYGATLQVIGKMLGDKILVEKGLNIKQKVRELSFNGEFFADHAVRENGKLITCKEYTETCQYYAMFFGLINNESDGAYIEKMLEKFGIFRNEKVVFPEVDKSNMFIGNFLRLEILRRFKKYKQLSEESRELFLKMALKTSSLWENRIIDKNYLENNVNGSCCHAFASVIGVWLTEALTGYQGFDSFKKEIYFGNERLNKEFYADIPIEEDKVLTLSLKKGKLTYILPEGYKAVII